MKKKINFFISTLLLPILSFVTIFRVLRPQYDMGSHRSILAENEFSSESHMNSQTKTIFNDTIE